MTPSAPVRYRISALDPRAHLFECRCTIDSPAQDGQRFRLPAWAPGSYLIREFARNFVRVRAEGDAGPVSIVKEAKDVWRAGPCNGPLTFIAEIYALDLSVRTAYLDERRGFFNGPAVFPMADGYEAAPVSLEVRLPAGAGFERWRIATTLDEATSKHQRGAWYEAESYDELIDHPVEMGELASAVFVAAGVPHEIALAGRNAADLPRACSDLQRICERHIALFGAPAPFRRYLFQVNVVGDGYGGLEHRSSTSLLCRRDTLPSRGMTAPTDDYVGFLGLASHEYFHAWNVKRIKPDAFTPYDLARENYTRQLWAFEGITSYYDDLALVRSGVIAVEKYLELVARTITTVLRTPGRAVQSLGDASFDAWIKFYRPDENSPNVTVSYYAKGALVALALDLTMRIASRATLDDVMRALWQRHGMTGVGVPDDAIPRIAAELSGIDVPDFFARYVDGTEDPPLQALMTSFGVTLHLRASSSDKDRGGSPAKPDDVPACSIGATVGNDMKLRHVLRHSPAERAGLAPGDALVAIDGLRATKESLTAHLKRRAPGDALEVHAFRRDELISVAVSLEPAPLDNCYFTVDSNAPAASIARRDAWLGSSSRS